MGGRITQRSKRMVIDRVDMAQVVGATVRLKRNGPSLVGLCPFHEEKTPSFHVNPRKKFFYCHGCGAGGDVITFVRELHGFSYVESLEHLAEVSGVQIEYEAADPRKLAQERAARSQRRRLLDLNKAAQHFFVQQLHGPAGETARRYLEKRGLSRETAERFGIGCAQDSWDALTVHLLGKGFEERELQLVGLGVPRRNGRGLYDRFRNRLMFPVHTTAGDLVAFGGRALGDDPRPSKYMNSPESELREVDAQFNRGLSHFYKKGRLVFGLWHARAGIRKRQSAIVVEGNLDVMMLHQEGFTNAVCFMGTAVTAAQVQEVAKFTNKVALVFDGDAAGRKAARKVVPLCIEAGLGGVFANLPDREDPDSYIRQAGVDAFDTLLRRAEPLVTGYIDAAVAEHDGTIHGKRKAIADVHDVLSRIDDPIVREMSRTHLARGLDIEPRDLNKYVRHVRSDRRPQQSSGSDAPAQIDEPAIAALEMDLVKILAHYPVHLPFVVDEGCIDDVQHPGLNAAIRHLAAAVDEGGQMDAQRLRERLHELPDGRGRRAFLEALVRPNQVPEDGVEAVLQLILDRLEARALQPRLDALTQQLVRAASVPERQAELAELVQEQQRISARIVELQKAMRTAARDAVVEQV